jgi:hypothetical protein
LREAEIHLLEVFLVVLEHFEVCINVGGSSKVTPPSRVTPINKNEMAGKLEFGREHNAPHPKPSRNTCKIAI